MTTITAEPINWSISQKVTFRFFLLFFVLYMFFNPNGVVPFSDTLSNVYIPPFHTLIPWIAKHILHLPKPITVFTNGSGDTTYDYVIILFMAFVSAVGTIVWSITGRNTKNYNKLLYWLTVIVRYYVAITMVAYGSFKVIKLQFPSPSPGKLIEPLGNMSPMGLAWTYLGYSVGFNYFAGCAELLCGLLLFFRKTTTLGAIIGLVVAGNIMAINYCFDVPVKILATFLVLMCIFLLLTEFTRLVNFFFKNKAALPSNLSPHRFKDKWKNITLTVIKYALVIYVVVLTMYQAVQGGTQYGEDAKKPALYGLYKVETFVRNHDTLPPLTTDTTRWSKFIVGRYEGNAQINIMNDSVKRVAIKTDTVKHTITFNTYTDTVHRFVFAYAINKAGLFTLKGKWKLDSLHIGMRRYDEKNFFLLKRGFHWVNENPLNR